MSLRGVHFIHRPGDVVLCFEPDPAKARILYDAKIVDLSVGRDSKGKRKPAYLVHFQGWKNRWDRIVPESLVLVNNEENRQLKRHITKVAKKARKNSIRKRKIEHILRETFPKKRRFDAFSYDSDSSAEEDHLEPKPDLYDTEEDNYNMTEMDQLEGESDSLSEGQEEDENSEEEMDEDGDDEEDDMEEFEEEPLREVLINLSDSLKRKLEDDCYNVKSKNRLLRLPAEPNVIGILEVYVRNFGANLVYSESKHYPSRSERDRQPPPEKNLDLCKEVADGLRTMFDFCFESQLLYAEERDYFQQSCQLFEQRVCTKSHIAATGLKTEPAAQELSSPAVHSTPARRHSRSLAPNTAHAHLHKASETSSIPTIPTPVCESKHKPDNIKTKEDINRADINANTCCRGIKSTRNKASSSPTRVERRITRRSHLSSPPALGEQTAVIHKNKNMNKTRSQASGNSNISADTKTKDSTHVGTARKPHQQHTPMRGRRRKISLRSQGHHQLRSSDDEEISFKVEPSRTLSLDSDMEDTEVEVKRPSWTVVSDNVVAEQQQQQQHDGSQKSSQHTGGGGGGNQSSESSVPSLVIQNGYHSKEAALSDIFSWKLVPADLYSQQPVAPSVVCGAHHFLRLFVVLPELLSRMRISQQHNGPLLAHIQMIVDYMSNSCEELLLDSAYVDA